MVLLPIRANGMAFYFLFLVVWECFLVFFNSKFILKKLYFDFIVNLLERLIVVRVTLRKLVDFELKPLDIEKNL
jgi:hypothetical protein